MPELILPYPPSANRYWRHARGRTFVSSHAIAYRADAMRLAKQSSAQLLLAPISLSLVLHPVWSASWEKRRRVDPHGHSCRCLDIDNAQKVLLDALQGIIYVNDNQIVDLSISRGVPVPQGQIRAAWTLWEPVIMEEEK